MKKSREKSVSFQQKEDKKFGSQPSAFPKFKNSWLSTPFHSVFLIAAMFGCGLTQEPRKVMLQGLLTLVILQGFFGYFITLKKEETEKKVKAKSVKLTKGFIYTLLLSFPICLLLFLFGAPFDYKVIETYILACHLSFLITYPLLILYDFDFTIVSQLVALDDALKIVARNQILLSSCMTAVGAWLGVIPIPLDWDRDWQQWPLTLLYGAYVGSFLGGISSLLIGNLL